MQGTPGKGVAGSVRGRSRGALQAARGRRPLPRNARQPTLAAPLRCPPAPPPVQLEGLGISSVAYLFTDFDYTRRDALTFPAKKLRVGDGPRSRGGLGLEGLAAWRAASVVPMAAAAGATWGQPRQGRQRLLTACMLPLPLCCPALQACWYAPPDPELPRVFISEIKVGGSPQGRANGGWITPTVGWTALMQPLLFLQGG